jgi:hypothetical protein
LPNAESARDDRVLGEQTGGEKAKLAGRFPAVYRAVYRLEDAA